MFNLKRYSIRKLATISTSWLPFADVATDDMPLSRLLRLSVFQVTVGMALVLLVGTLNRVMIVELQVPATLVAIMLALPLLFAPFRALIGFKSDNHRSALGVRRLPFIIRGSMLQFGGFAIMPFALLVLSGYGEAVDAPRWVGLSATALAFLLVGAGVHIVQTVGLALATDLVKQEDQPKVVGLMYVSLLLGMMVSAWIYAAILETYTPGRLIQVIQATAVLSLVLNGFALWKQEPRSYTRAMAPKVETSFRQAWRQLTAQKGVITLLVIIALGTAGFGMADVLLEPFGGQVLAMTVSETTRLTVILALGSLFGFGLASFWLGRDARPINVALLGAIIGIPAFVAVIASALMLSTPLLVAATLAAGFGAGLFGHGTLTASMRAAPKEQTGLALGAWGAVQTTAAGIAISAGGLIRDALLVTDPAVTGDPALAASLAARPYLPVFALEALLLLGAVLLAIRVRARPRRTPEISGLGSPTS